MAIKQKTPKDQRTSKTMGPSHHTASRPFKTQSIRNLYLTQYSNRQILINLCMSAMNPTQYLIFF